MCKENKIIITSEKYEENVQFRKNFDELGFVTEFVPNNGISLVEKIKREKPTAVLMNVFMYGLDAISVITEIEKLNALDKPIIIVNSEINNSLLIAELLRSGAAYYLLKPFDIQNACIKIASMAIKSRILSEEIKEVEPNYSLEEMVTIIMTRIGIPASLKGYRYLRDCIILAVEDSRYLKGVTNNLYPTVAQKNNSTGVKVERSIRNAIEIAWNRGNEKVQNEYFGYTVMNLRGRPTNVEFIAMISDRISLKLKNKN